MQRKGERQKQAGAQGNRFKQQTTKAGRVVGGVCVPNWQDVDCTKEKGDELAHTKLHKKQPSPKEPASRA